MNRSSSSSGQNTTYLISAKADDASNVALGSGRTNGADSETLDMEPLPDGSRRPGGRTSIPSPDDWSEREENGTGNGSTANSNNNHANGNGNGNYSNGNGNGNSNGNDSRIKRSVARGGSVEDIEYDDGSGHQPSGRPMANSNSSISSAPASASSSTAGIHPSVSHTQQHHQHYQSPFTPAEDSGPRLFVQDGLGPPVQITAGHFSMQGIRPEMEDRVTLLPHPDFNKCGSLPDNLNRSFFAVFDGHGGDVSAEYCRQHVHNNMILSEAFLNGRPGDGLRAALLKTEAEFCAACRRINLMTSSGTTAITAYIEGDMIYIGNVGDSRAVLCRSGRAVDASVDHKPGRKDERARIEALGGRVGITEEDAFRESPRPCPCLWSCVSAGRPLRVFPGGLSVSRTIGDISMKVSQLVSAEPEMFEARLTAADEFLILACDGVWDVMNSQQAVDIVRGNLFRSNNNAEEASKHLANEAFRKGSTDNISVVVITLEYPKSNTTATQQPAQGQGQIQAQPLTQMTKATQKK